ncbi:LLM class flavin-dependent oxidoreductase [Streptomyces sp. JNUCC 63]
MVTLAPDDLTVLRERVAACERAGLTAVGIGDSPGYHDVYVSLTVAAQASSRLRIGPMVTNVVTRAPQVTARALGSVDEIAEGRVFAGIGAGDSALVGAGAARPGLAELRDGLEQLRRHWPPPSAAAPVPGRPPAAEPGSPSPSASGQPSGDRPWRVVVTSNGPRTLALGGSMADLVVSGAGVGPGAVGRAVRAVASGARASGRPPDSVPVWVVARVAVADERDKAVEQLLPLLASAANHVFRVRTERDTLPPDAAAKVAELHSAYDYSAHGRRYGNTNADLVERLGLRDLLAARFAVAGPPAEVASGLNALAGQGVAGVVVPAVGLDVDTLIHRLGHDVLPLLRRHREAS